MRSLAHRAFVMAVVVVAPYKSAEFAQADEAAALEDIEVVGTTPTHGVGLPVDKIPANVQTATSQDLDRAQALDLSSFMNRELGSVTLNAAQNNPLQPDLQFRGLTASPLLGLPQGLAVYQNSVRINEVFGDTLNWDLIPESAIASINLVAGANPLFGQNTLGGALSVITKTGSHIRGIASRFTVDRSVARSRRWKQAPITAASVTSLLRVISTRRAGVMRRHPML